MVPTGRAQLGISLALREKDVYEIQWTASPKKKWVKRLNLFFEDESKLGFRFRLRQARRRKEQVRRPVCFLRWLL